MCTAVPGHSRQCCGGVGVARARGLVLSLQTCKTLTHNPAGTLMPRSHSTLLSLVSMRTSEVFICCFANAFSSLTARGATFFHELHSMNILVAKTTIMYTKTNRDNRNASNKSISGCIHFADALREVDSVVASHDIWCGCLLGFLGHGD